MRPSPLAVLSAAVFALGLLWLGQAQAEPLAPESVPPALRPWTSWVLHGHKKQQQCPFFAGDEEARLCSWPSRLELKLEEQGGKFVQSWELAWPGRVFLPGGDGRWPLDVQVDGKPAVVLERQGRPEVQLPAGRHTVQGLFRWDSLPEALKIPPQTGLLALRLRGQRVDFPERDPTEGQVWLRRQLGGQSEQEQLEVVVHRQVLDENPLLVQTRLLLYAAGKSREVLLGRALLPEFVPMALQSALPARLESDGKLRVQLRPGKWVVQLLARRDQPVEKITLPEPQGPWAAEEVWVFRAQPELRLVWVKGVPAIDPQQTTLPQEWRQLPAYRVRPEESFVLEQRRRGDSDPPPDNLTLARILWLDFDGGGMTIADQIGGTLRQSWRLEMQPPIQLGRFSVDGQDQFITVQGEQKLAGVEIRQGNLQSLGGGAIQADSRYEEDVGAIPAVGWNHDFRQVSASLYLPPGWQLLHAAGADEVQATWITRWSLLDLFLLLILALATGKLFGWPWGVVALLTLGLTLPEQDAPRWIWGVLLILEALRRVLPDGWVGKSVRLARAAVAILLVIVAIPFMVQQVRVGMYPVLEDPYQRFGEEGANEIPDWLKEQSQGQLARASGGKQAEPDLADEAARVSGVLGMLGEAQAPREGVLGMLGEAQAPREEVAAAQVQAASPEPLLDADESAIAKGQQRRGKAKSVYGLGGLGLAKRKVPVQTKQQLNLLQHDPNAMVQTGPGLQSWRWQEIPLRWSGPVKRDQQLRLWLASPGLNLALAVLRVALLALLVLLVGGLLSWRPGRSAAGLGLLAVLLVLAPPAQAQVPTPELLEQLQQRLLQPPDCFPDCAASDRLQLEARGDRLRLRLEVGAQAATAFPLPGQDRQWLPTQVLVDGKSASGLAQREGRLWLWLTPGRHQILLEGPLPESETVQLALPVKPHRVEATVEGWRLEGLHEDGLADDNLQLTRIQASTGGGSVLQPGALPPFVQIERTIILGLSWQVETRVTRLTPTGSAVVLEVPLLEGESITGDLRVEQGKALVNMGPEVTEVSWRSVLKETDKLQLEASQGVSWSEQWELQASPIWHVEFAGLPPIHPQNEQRQQPRWRPWPGEKLLLTITRPRGIKGQTLTIDQARLELRPGLRATEMTLRFRARSSQGIQHTLRLPEGSQLQQAQVDGQVQPVRQEGRKVTLPLSPGAQRVELRWRQEAGITTYYRVPDVDLGAPAVNVSQLLVVPGGRWVLFAGGLRVGPAVLFWSLLGVLLIVALVLGRSRFTPLRTIHWMLLFIGLSQLPIWAAALVVGWLFLTGWRARSAEWGHRLLFDLRQLLLVGWSLVALIVLFAAVHQGLLGAPEMQIRGNGSGADSLRWFADRTAGGLAQPWVISAPMYVYRLAMLAWALWLAWALIGWLRWLWSSLSAGGLWRRLRDSAAAAVAPTAGEAAAAPPDADRPSS